MKNSISGMINKKDFDYSVRPQDDFFHFAAGGWIKRNPIPKTEVRWGSFYVLRDENRKKIREIFNNILKKKNVSKNSTTRLLRDFYQSGLDEQTIERLGMTPLQKELERIRAMKAPSDLLAQIAHFHTLGISLLWNTFTSLDEKDSEKMALYVYQGNLGLPEREYYLSKKGKFPELRKKYLLHIANMLRFAGVSKKDAALSAARILALETTLARASMSAEERRDVIRQYNKMPTAKLRTLAPQLNWREYFNIINVAQVKTVIVGQPSYVALCGKLFAHISLDDWKSYSTFLLISNFSEMLPRKISEESFRFYGKILTGQKERKPRWQRVIGVVDSAMTEAIGKEYVAQHFSKHAEAIMEEMVQNLKLAYRARIKKLDWMTPATKTKALTKLSTFRSKLVQPKHPRDYRELSIDAAQYLHNVLFARQSEFFREMKKLSRPIDRNEWFMGAHVVNAYYWSSQNEIVFPAGILQPPFFDPSGDIAMNYGSIGAIIGHEFTHGFDDKGSLFDEKGNLKNWWTKQDRTAFEKKTKIIVEQYNRFVATDDIYVNGELTLGENIADLGGIVLAYDALQMYMKKHGRLPKKNGYTPEQRFFLGCVVSERGATRKEATRLQALSDPHAPAYTRINGPLAHLESFYSAFDVKAGDTMYRAPNKRALIW